MPGTIEIVSDNEASLLLRARSGDAEAFGVFFDRHGDRMLRYFRVRTADAATAADLCAETFAAALESLPRFDPDKGAPLGWLYGIARHKYLRWLNSSHVERRARERLGLRVDTHHVDDLDMVDLRIDLAQLVGPLHEAIGCLSDAVRDAVTLRVVHELPYAEVAQSLGCSEVAARARVSRGLAALLAHVERITGTDPEVDEL